MSWETHPSGALVQQPQPTQSVLAGLATLTSHASIHSVHLCHQQRVFQDDLAMPAE